MSALPFGPLTYLYLGSKAFDEDLAYYRDVLKAELVWNYAKFGARVAAFRLGPGPMVLIADHRPGPSCILIYAVAALDEAAEDLKARGWQAEGGVFEVPDGPVLRFHDPSGNPYAILQITRPHALE